MVHSRTSQLCAIYLVVGCMLCSIICSNHQASPNDPIHAAMSTVPRVSQAKNCTTCHRLRAVPRVLQAKNEGSTTGQGRWPVKSVKYVLNLLKNAESNAEVRSAKACFAQQLSRVFCSALCSEAVCNIAST